MAGFIGVSNLLERAGRRFTIRPEKIRLSEAGEPGPPGYHVESGRIDDVIYLGVVTRYVIELDAGGTVIAVSQNRETAAADELEARGRRVAVSWRDDQSFEISEPSMAEAPAAEEANNDSADEGVDRLRRRSLGLMHRRRRSGGPWRWCRWRLRSCSLA